MEPWVWALIVSVAGGLIAVIYRAGQHRDDKQDARFEKDERTMADHIKDDVTAHERIKALEIKVDNHDREIASIRERWHDMRSEISTTLGNWYVNIVKMIGKQ